MSKITILGTDKVKDSRQDLNSNYTELYATKTEVENARDGESTLLAQINYLQALIAALASGSGVVISSNDTTAGYINGKLIVGNDIEFEEIGDGGDETMSIGYSPSTFFWGSAF